MLSILLSNDTKRTESLLQIMACRSSAYVIQLRITLHCYQSALLYPYESCISWDEPFEASPIEGAAHNEVLFDHKGERAKLTADFKQSVMQIWLPR